MWEEPNKELHDYSVEREVWERYGNETASYNLDICVERPTEINVYIQHVAHNINTSVCMHRSFISSNLTTVMHIHIYHVYIYIYICVCVYVCICIHPYIYIYIHTCVRVICVYVCMCMYIYLYMYVSRIYRIPTGSSDYDQAEPGRSPSQIGIK